MSRRSKITIKHGPLKKFDMEDGMTMVFRAGDPAMLKRSRPGDRIKFVPERINGQFTVTKNREGKVSENRRKRKVLRFLEILALILTAVTLTFALAHAAELPGKLRLSKEAYMAVQPIYYPGFTLGAFSEPAAIVVLIPSARYNAARQCGVRMDPCGTRLLGPDAPRLLGDRSPGEPVLAKGSGFDAPGRQFLFDWAAARGVSSARAGRVDEVPRQMGIRPRNQGGSRVPRIICLAIAVTSAGTRRPDQGRVRAHQGAESTVTKIEKANKRLHRRAKRGNWLDRGAKF